MQAGTVKDHVLAGVRAAIIDLDGTMLDTVPDFHVAINGMRAELDLAPISADAIKLMVGKGSENLIRTVLALDFDAAGVEQRFEQAMDGYQRHYLAINGQFSTLYPDVEAGLAAMKAAGLRLACVTNKPIAFALPLLKQKKLDGYFEIVYGGDSLPRKNRTRCRCCKCARTSTWRPPKWWPSATHRTTRKRPGCSLPRIDGTVWLQPRTLYTRYRFRWYSKYAARSGRFY